MSLLEIAARPPVARDDEPLLPVLLDAAQAFCARHVDPARIDAHGLGELLAPLAEQGWFGLTVPARFGGAGLSLAATARLVAVLAAADGSLGTCVGLHSGLGLHALLHGAAAPLAERVLPDVAVGKRICAFAATEPEAGSDIAGVRTTLSEDGDGYLLQGTKCYVTNGRLAGLVTVLARSPGLGGARAGHTLVVVDPATPGVSRGPEERKLGLKGSSTCTLTFEGVRVPREHVLGELSQGLVHAHAALTWGRALLSAGCLGTARAALEQASAHVADRRQFGRPLLDQPLVQESIADLRADVLAVERVVAFATTAESLALPTLVSKVFSSEVASSVVDRAVQLLGGAGCMEEVGMARRLRDVRVTRIFEGANDVLRLSLASDALRWPALDVEVGDPSFDERLRLLSETLAAVRARWGFRLFTRQALQAHVADALVAMVAALACRVPGDAGEDLAGHAVARRFAEFDRAIAAARAPVDPAHDARVARLARA